MRNIWCFTKISKSKRNNIDLHKRGWQKGAKHNAQKKFQYGNFFVVQSGRNTKKLTIYITKTNQNTICAVFVDQVNWKQHFHSFMTQTFVKRLRRLCRFVANMRLSNDSENNYRVEGQRAFPYTYWNQALKAIRFCGTDLKGKAEYLQRKYCALLLNSIG